MSRRISAPSLVRQLGVWRTDGGGPAYRQLADGEFNHTSALVLLDAEGRVVARTEQVGSKVDPEFMAAVHRVLAR